MKNAFRFYRKSQADNDAAEPGVPCAAPAGDENAILTLIVGSLAGASKRDVTAYMRGIAEAHITAKDTCYLGLRRQRGRWLYEIHEGGPGLSVLDNVAAHLDVSPDASLYYQLADGRVVEIIESENDVISVIFPKHEDKPIPAEPPVFSRRKLAPYIGTGAALRTLGTVLLGFGFTALVLAGGAHVLANSLIDTDRLLRREAAARPLLNTAAHLPIFEFERARKSALTSGGYIHKIAFDNGHWTSAVQPRETPPSSVRPPRERTGVPK